MEKDLLKSLVNFFFTLEKIDTKWWETCRGVEDALEALKNYSEELRYVSSKQVDNVEICKIQNVQTKLIQKINLGIEEEIQSIMNTVRNLGNLNQELRNKLIQLERVRSKVFIDDPNMKEIVEGSAYRPRLDLLLEWAIQAHEYYQQLYSEINENFKAIDRKKEETIIKLIEGFRNKGNRSEINRILGFTQYLAHETIR